MWIVAESFEIVLAKHHSTIDSDNLYYSKLLDIYDKDFIKQYTQTYKKPHVYVCRNYEFNPLI